MKVLIIDDEAVIRRALVRGFKSKNFEVFEAEDAFLGEELWVKEVPDLVVIDVIMPNRTGPELVDLLKDFIEKEQTKVALMSAYSGEYNTSLAKYKNIDLFIKKPFVDIFKVIDDIVRLVN